MKKSYIHLIFCISFCPSVIFAELDNVVLERLNRDFIKVSQLRDAAQPDRRSNETLIDEKNKAFLELVKKRVSKNEFDVIRNQIASTTVISHAQIEKDYFERIDATKNIELDDRNQSLVTSLISSTQTRLQAEGNIPFIAKNKKERALEKKMSLRTLNSLSPKEESSPKQDSSNHASFRKSVSVQETEKQNTERFQVEALRFSKQDQKKLKSQENDSLFKKITKAYHRNLEKIILDQK